MPPLSKPHRVALLIPDLTVDGPDAAYEREAALLLWTACIETCQRHPGLAVYDPESTPLVPQDGHFAPDRAGLGASPSDAFHAPTRRDELIWIELTLPKSGVVRLHAVGRDGKRRSFEALGRNVGDQINQVLAAWLAARPLPALPRRFDAVAGDDILAVTRVIGPVLAEQARGWMKAAGAAPSPDADVTRPERDGDGDGHDPAEPAAAAARTRSQPRVARTVANRLPQPLRVPALRTLELALREDLGDLILKHDPEHPQALFAQFVAGAGRGRDFALLRRVIAAAPGWARPYGELVAPDGDDRPLAPTALETVAGAGMVALCRPAHLDVVDVAAERLRGDGRIDEAVRTMARAVRQHDRDARAHAALVQLHRATDRPGAWLDQAQRSARAHGCPLDPFLPWYPDQIQIDLVVADALVACGRLAEAIALRANRLDGREATWPRHNRVLTSWRKDPRFAAWCYAREGAFRGDPARAVEGFARVAPDDALDLALLLDALVALGRENEVGLAWAQLGLGRGLTGPVARLAAARGLLAAGEWRRGLEELWRVELTEPGRDDHVAIARCGLLLACMPLEVAEAALAERFAVGAHTLARRMARDIADFVPGAASSSIVMRALGKPTALDFDPAWLSGFAATTRSRRAIDALFGELRGNADPRLRADRLVDRWLEVVFSEAGEAEPAALAQAAAYTAAHALGRYLAATTAAPSPLAGGLRAVAAEALALVGRHHAALADRDAHALLAVFEPVLRRVDRWVGAAWLATVERSCAIDERAAGDVAGFARELATVAARILGPEEVAVLSMSVARLHRERPDGWDSAAATQAERLAQHTGRTGLEAWCDGLIAQLAARTLDPDDAIDALHTACYLAEGITAAPAVHAARVLFGAGRAHAAHAALTAGLSIASAAQRDRELATLADAWQQSNLDIPLAADQAAAGLVDALQAGDPARAEKLGRWAVACDPGNAEAHRGLGLALAQQGRLIDALHHLVRGAREQATQLLSEALYQAGKLPEAMAVLDHASRWYVRADQWLSHGGIAYAALDNPRAMRAYSLAYRLDPDAFDASQLNAYAGVLDEVGEHVRCEAVANHLLRLAGDDLVWKTTGWHHLACALIGQGKLAEALQHAERAVADNPQPDNAATFAATLERAKSGAPPPLPPDPPPGRPREPVFGLIEAGELAAAAALVDDPSWRVRRAALGASRFRGSADNHVAVPPRALAAAGRLLAVSAGVRDREALLCRVIALDLREQAWFARDPLPQLGERMTRAAFYQELRARGGVVIGDDPPAPPPFADRVVVPGGAIARVSDYIALLRDLAALTPREALAQFGLDHAGYLEVARAWAAAIQADPSLAATIEAGLANR